MPAAPRLPRMQYEGYVDELFQSTEGAAATSGAAVTSPAS